MNGILNMLINRAMTGQLQNMPQMQMFNQMMAGKTFEQQKQTLFNMAESKGFDINAKIFSEQDLQMFGIIPRKG